MRKCLAGGWIIVWGFFLWCQGEGGVSCYLGAFLFWLIYLSNTIYFLLRVPSYIASNFNHTHPSGIDRRREMGVSLDVLSKDTFIFCACIINQSRLDCSLFFYTHICSGVETTYQKEVLLILRSMNLFCCPEQGIHTA